MLQARRQYRRRLPRGEGGAYRLHEEEEGYPPVVAQRGVRGAVGLRGELQEEGEEVRKNGVKACTAGHVERE